MKLGLYSDPHYSSKGLTCGIRRNNQSLRKICEAYDHFKQENCDLVVCLGDLIDTEDSVQKITDNLQMIAEIIDSSGIPTVCLMGNHDAFSLGARQFYSVLASCAPHDLEKGDRLLLFLDACYYKSGEPYPVGNGDWTDTYYPQKAYLDDKLKAARGDVYLFIHQNIDPAVPADHRLYNADELFDLINQSGVVKYVFQGHFHEGCENEYCGVKYITLPAMCQNEGAYYVYHI